MHRKALGYILFDSVANEFLHWDGERWEWAADPAEITAFRTWQEAARARNLAGGDVHVTKIWLTNPIFTTLADAPAMKPPSAFTAADRCDRCGAQAYVRATLHVGGELLFCAHHGREHLPKLRDHADIVDESDRLVSA